MTPAQLKAFAAVVRHGSARGAAAELGVSEAAISAHTSALRRELDDPLYRRASSGLAFTPGGLRLATRAAELLGLQDLTRMEVRAAGQGRRMLRLTATSMFAEFAAPGLIELFKTRADDLEVELSVDDRVRFPELLASRQADVTIGPKAVLTPTRTGGGGPPALPTSGPAPPPTPLATREFLRYQLMLVLAPRHPLASGRPTRRQLVAVPWLLGPSATDHGGATAQLLRRFQVPEAQQRIFQSHAAALAEARDGHGIGIAPEFGIREALTTGRLRPVSAAGATAQAMWEATTLPADQAPPVATELARFVTTPRAIQSMLSGAGANVGRFRPRVHVTLWS